MAFPASFDDIKNRVYVVGLYNDVDDDRRRKFFLFGPKPDGVTLPDYHDLSSGYRSFVPLVEPQDRTAQSGLLNEDNWFFRVGDAPSVNEPANNNLLVGFPGQNIFGSVQQELVNLAGLLSELVGTYFSEFTRSLEGLGGEWKRGDRLPEGLLRLFLEGLAEGWLYRKNRPKKVTEGLAARFKQGGFPEWEEEFKTGPKGDELLTRMEAWAQAKWEVERQKKPESPFVQHIGAIEKLVQICGNRTLMRLLAFWPYQHILERARAVWLAVPSRDTKPHLKDYVGEGEYETWDFLLATKWINKKASLADVEGDDLSDHRAALDCELSRLKPEVTSGPPLPDPVLRDTADERRRQVERHVKGWELLFTSNPDQLAEDERREAMALLECADDKTFGEAVAVARQYHQLWAGLVGVERKVLDAVRQKSARTFARMALPAFEALFQAPGFGADRLPQIYEDEFVRVYAECLLEESAEAVADVRNVGAGLAAKYQPAGGETWKAGAEKRKSLRAATSRGAAQRVIEQARRGNVALKLATAAPAARYFAYGVNRQARRSPASALVYFVRYNRQIAGTASETAQRVTRHQLLPLMRDGLRASVEASLEGYVREKVAAFNGTPSTGAPRLELGRVEVVRAGPHALPLYQPDASDTLVGVNLLESRNLVESVVPRVAAGHTARIAAEQENVKNVEQALEQKKVEAERVADEIKRAASPPPDSKEARALALLKEQQEERAGAVEKLEQQLAAAKDALTLAVPVDVELTLSEPDEERIARHYDAAFQDAWTAILGAKKSPGLQRLLLTEFLLVTQNQLGDDPDQWIDLQLLLDLVGCGSLDEFLAAHSLTKYSDRIDGSRGLAGVFASLSRLAASSLEAVRRKVSVLHGTRVFLNACATNPRAQVVFFNGTAGEFLDAVVEENLTREVRPKGGRGRLPKRFLEIKTGGGQPSGNFFAPACVYFTPLAFGDRPGHRPGDLPARLHALPLRERNNFGAALPPMLLDLGAEYGPDPFWDRDDVSNPLTTVPLHHIGPSPWHRPPGLGAEATRNHFATVLPAGFLFLTRLLGGGTPHDRPVPALPSDRDFVFSLAQTESTTGLNLDAPFRIDPDRPSFVVTFNLYLALLNALVSHWQDSDSVGDICAPVPADGTVARELWNHVAFDANTQPRAGANAVRGGDGPALLGAAEWSGWWWNGPVAAARPAGQTLLPLKRDAREIRAAFVGWLLAVLARYRG